MAAFFTPDHKARFVVTTPRAPVNATDQAFPLVLNTGRVRDQWHTMTRTAKALRLNTHRFEPYVEIHPHDAQVAGVEDGSLAELSTAWGRMVARARIATEQRQGCLFVPMHWTGEFSNSGRVNALTNPVTDPVSGQPELKHTPVALQPYLPRWQAFALTRTRLDPMDVAFWVRGQTGTCWRTEMAGDVVQTSGFEGWARGLLGVREGTPGWIAYRDTGAGDYRFAIVQEGRLNGCLFIGRDHRLPPREWLSGLFGKPALSDGERKALLLGEPLDPGQDIGAIVCSCFGIGRKQIASAIEEGASSVAAIGACLKAGTNCGSCKPELGKMVQTFSAANAQMAGSPLA